MYGMTAIAPMITAPQTTIPGVDSSGSVLGRVDGEIIKQHLFTLTLLCVITASCM
jgi:hypothetical protein